MKRILLLAIFCFSTSLLFSQNFKFGKVSKAELEEKIYPLDSSASAAYLYKYKRVFHEYVKKKGWRLVTEIHERVKIYNKEGYKYGTHQVILFRRGRSIETVNSLKAYTYFLKNGKIEKRKLAKGSVFKEKRTKNLTKFGFTMPNINEGVVLEYRYILFSPFRTQIDNLILQHNIPIKKLIAIVKTPDDYIFRKRLKGYLKVEIKRREANRIISYGAGRTRHVGETEISIEKNDIPALKGEDFVFNINNYRSEYIFELASTNFPGSQKRNYNTTWEVIAKKIYKSSFFGDELKRKRYYKEDLKLVISGTKNDELSRVEAVLQFVKSKVKWNGNYGKYTEKGVRKAYKEGLGNVADINLMLTSMLRSVGFNANPVLISTKGNGVSLFPTSKGLNYVISVVIFANETYVLLDATEPYSLPNVLPIRDLNWEGRLVESEGDSYPIPLDVRKVSVEDNNLNIKMLEDGTGEGVLRSKYTLYNALMFRKKYNHIKEDDLISKIEEKYEIEISDFRLSNKIEIKKPISRLIKFSGEDYIEDVSGKKYVIPLLFLKIQKNPFKLDERKYPIEYTVPWKNVNRVSLQIPEGYIVGTAPKAMAIELPDGLGFFKYQVRITEGVVKVISVVQISESIVLPEYYQSLKDFFKKIVEKQSEKIVLIKN